jgi:hypothetical protein
LYSSELLARLWPLGYSSIGDVTFQSAAYVARYVMKKRMTSSLGDRSVEIIDVDTGEVFRRVAEFNHMSNRPGVGAEWFKRFRGEVYPRGKVVVNGAEQKAPKYYDKLYEELDPFGKEALDYSRYVEARAFAVDCTDERLRVREEVKLSQLKMLKRKL